MKHLGFSILILLALETKLNAMDPPSDKQITALTNTLKSVVIDEEAEQISASLKEIFDSGASDKEWDDFLLPLLVNQDLKTLKSALRGLNNFLLPANDTKNKLKTLRIEVIRNRPEIMDAIFNLLRHHRDLEVIKLAFIYHNSIKLHNPWNIYDFQTLEPWIEKIGAILEDPLNGEVERERCLRAINYLSQTFTKFSKHHLPYRFAPRGIIISLEDLLKNNDTNLLICVLNYLSALASKKENAESINSSTVSETIIECLKINNDFILRQANSCLLNLVTPKISSNYPVPRDKVILKDHTLFNFICVLLNNDEAAGYVYPALTRSTAGYLSHVFGEISDSDKEKLSRLGAFRGLNEFLLGENYDIVFCPQPALSRKHEDFCFAFNRQIDWGDNIIAAIEMDSVAKLMELLGTTINLYDFFTRTFLIESIIKIINADEIGLLQKQIIALNGREIIVDSEKAMHGYVLIQPNITKSLQSNINTCLACLEKEKLPPVTKAIKHNLSLTLLPKTMRGQIKCWASMLLKSERGHFGEQLMLINQLPLLTEIKFQILIGLWLSHAWELANKPINKTP